MHIELNAFNSIYVYACFQQFKLLNFWSCEIYNDVKEQNWIIVKNLVL